MSEPMQMTNEDMNTPASRFLFSYLLAPGRRGLALDADAVSGWTQADGDLWVHIDIANREARQWLEQESGLPPHAIEALLAEETRPRTLSAMSARRLAAAGATEVGTGRLGVITSRGSPTGSRASEQGGVG